MTIEELNITTKLSEKQKRSIKNDAQCLLHWQKASSYYEFIELVKNDESLKCEKVTADLFKGNWYFLRHQLGEKSIKTESDAGALRIGVDGLELIIPNGYGDGYTRCAVFESEDMVNTWAFTYLFAIKGENIKIYEYDCGGSEIVKEFSGKYWVYANDGFVIFVQRKCMRAE